MTDMDRETLEQLLRPADLDVPVEDPARDAAGDARTAELVARMLAERRKHADVYDRLLLELDGVA